MAEDDQGEKEFEPTQRKLDEARRKGDVPKSNDLTTAAAQGGLLLAILALGGPVAQRLGASLSRLLRDSVRLSQDAFDGGLSSLAGSVLQAVAVPVLPLFVIPAVCAIAALVAQRGFVASGDKLMPKGSRVNPLSNAKQKFGASGLFEFGKSTIKMLVVATVLGLYLASRLPGLVASVAAPERAGMILLIDTLTTFILLAVLIGAVIGGIDFLWQRFSHTRKLRMTRKEMQDEHKQSEGDPHLKQQRRQKGYDIATNRMLQDVPDADVVIVNPTHYAVALKWERKPGRAPICVAKGVDEIAARIRERAATAGVPVHRDPPTARTIYAAIDIGHEIEPEHYKTVAAAIRFAEDVRRRAREMGR